MSEYRFFINEHDGNGEPTIIRAKPYKAEHGDQWDYYWDGDQMVAITKGWHAGSPDLHALTDNDDTERVYAAMNMAYAYDQDESAVLKHLAVRLTGQQHADFICVSLDRGYDVYALSWDGDADRTWRDEIEAVYHGDVWRIETWEYNTFTESWDYSDEVPEEYYGEDNAASEWIKAFPLDAFPAHLVITEAVGA